MKRIVLERLMHYYLCVYDGGPLNSSEWISSAEIAGCSDMDATQVRKDLAHAGVRGRPHRGYRREEVLAAIRELLGLDQEHRAVIVGAGRLGGAIAEYGGFRDYGLCVAALFDNDPKKVGATVGGCKVMSTRHMKRVVRSHGAVLGILTCPAEAAQQAADRLVDAGVRAIWNFAPNDVSVPDGVAVRNEHIGVGLAELSHFLKR